jgi:hypothetical protein
VFYPKCITGSKRLYLVKERFATTPMCGRTTDSVPPRKAQDSAADTFFSPGLNTVDIIMQSLKVK